MTKIDLLNYNGAMNDTCVVSSSISKELRDKLMKTKRILTIKTKELDTEKETIIENTKSGGEGEANKIRKEQLETLFKEEVVLEDLPKLTKEEFDAYLTANEHKNLNSWTATVLSELFNIEF